MAKPLFSTTTSHPDLAGQTISLAALLLALTGCASAHWTRDNATPRELRMDEAQCRKEAAVATSGTGGLVAIATYEAVRHDCMIARGWVDAS